MTVHRPTIADVARRAGVSRATVSRVLNGHASVDPDLASRVRMAADRLGYRPNPTALGLARGVTGVFGVIVPDLANPFFPELLKAIEAAAATADCRMIVADSDEDAAQEVRLAEDLCRRCDGLILCSPRMSTARLRRLLADRTPIVLANRVEDHLGIPAAAIAIERVVDEVVAHLVELGHRRICYLAGPANSWSNATREAAFRTATRARKLRSLVIRAGSSTEDGYEAASALPESSVTAIVAFNDLVAFGALERYLEAGRNAPTDISLVGFDDIPAARFTAPPLTTVRFPKAELGQIAWQLLKERLDGRPAVVRWVEPTFVARGSTAPPPA